MSYKTPIWYLSVVTFVGLAMFFVATYLSQNQPFLGLSLHVSGNGEVQLRKDGVGAAAELKAGWTLERIKGGDKEHAITAYTLTEEPDTLGTKANLRAFLKDQDALFRTINAGPVTLSGQTPDGPWEAQIQAQPSRSLWYMPSGLWLHLFSGLIATLVGGWVWSLNPKGMEQLGLLISGVGLQLSASMAAIYSSREIALSGELFPILSALNYTGTLSFGVGLMMVFGAYPKRFLRGRAIWLPLILVALFVAMTFLLDVQSLNVAMYVPIVLLLIGILVLITVQFIAARKDLMARAALRVLGLGVVMGAGVFVMTRAVPILLGLETAVSQAILFPLIALFFVSVALSVVRYRLFDMPRWSALLLFYFLGACLVLAMDTALIYGLALGRQPALALSLLCVGFAYLPLRDRMMHFVTRRSLKNAGQTTSLLAMADFIARADTPQQMQSRWKDGLETLFEPLDLTEMSAETSPIRPSLIDFGRALELPPLKQGMSPLRLVLPKRGQRLFTADDRAKATEVLSLVAELQRGHAAYDIGVETERARVARDLHDNISIHLLGALHSEDSERKNAFVRETLGNLRQIISGDPAARTDLGLLLNELRFRIAETLTAKGIELDWPVRDLRGVEADAVVAQTIRAITYEAITNVIRHSNAQNVSISVATAPHEFTLKISDDGIGLAPHASLGNGLNNMQERVAQLGGSVDSGPGQNEKGLAWVFKIPRIHSDQNEMAQSA